MRSLAALAALLGTAAAGNVNIAVTDACTDASACKVTPFSINAPKSAAQPGSFSFNGTGTATAAIDSSAKMNLNLKLGGTSVLNKDVDGCGAQSVALPLGLGSVDIAGFACPIASGASATMSATVSTKTALPTSVVAIATFTQGADNLVIINIDITPAAGLRTSDACNASDDKIWNATGYNKFQDEMTSCGKSCLGQKECMAGCVVKDEGYTKPCSECFGDCGQCTAQHCLTKCLTGRTPACAQCVKDAGCDAAFTKCTGWTPPP